MIITIFERPSVIASSINEVNEVTGGPTTKSFECRLQLVTRIRNISPIIDTGTIGALGIMNRINDIDSFKEMYQQDEHLYHQQNQMAIIMNLFI